MTVRVYDSAVGLNCLKKLETKGTIPKFKKSLIALLDGIGYWTKANRPIRKEEDIVFEVVPGLPQQTGKLGDCGVFLCMWLEQLVSGQPLTLDRPADKACIDFRTRMAKIFIGSRLKPV